MSTLFPFILSKGDPSHSLVTRTNSYFYTMTRFFSLRLLGLALVPLLLVFSACDSSGDEDTETDNEFTLDVNSTSSSSALSAKSAPDTTLKGFSFFYDGEDPETSEAVFAIYFNGDNDFSQSSTQEGPYGFIVRKSSRPSTGTYNIASVRDVDGIDEQDFVGLIYEKIDEQDPNTGLLSAPFHFLESGTLTLNESTDDRVSGTIDGTGVSFTIDTSGQTPQYNETSVQITGSFAARNVENFANVDPSTPSN